MQFKIFSAGSVQALENLMNRWIETDGKGVQIVSVTNAIGQEQIPGGTIKTHSTVYMATVCFKK